MTEQEYRDTGELLDFVEESVRFNDFWYGLDVGDLSNSSHCHTSPIHYRPGMRPWLFPLCLSAIWFVNGIVVSYLFFLLTAN